MRTAFGVTVLFLALYNVVTNVVFVALILRLAAKGTRYIPSVWPVELPAKSTRVYVLPTPAKMNTWGITLGDIVWLDPSALDSPALTKRVLAHEFTHVRQWKRWRWVSFFAPIIIGQHIIYAFGWSPLFSLERAEKNSPWEKAARRAAGEPV